MHHDDVRRHIIVVSHRKTIVSATAQRVCGAETRAQALSSHLKNQAVWSKTKRTPQPVETRLEDWDKGAWLCCGNLVVGRLLADG